MTLVKLGPFLGPITSLDPRAIEALYAQDTSNYRYEDGKLLPRYGYRNLAAAQTNFESAHGLAYLQGFTSADALSEEFVAFERLSTYAAAKCRPFSRHVSTGAATAITNGGTPVDLTNVGDWRAFAWDDVSYFTNPNDTVPVYRHTLGTATSLQAFSTPADPTTALTYRVDLKAGGGSQYEVMSWATIDAADLAVTGAATTTVPPSPGFNDGNGGMRIQHSATPQPSSVEVDMNGITAGIQDRSYNDLYAFAFTTPTSGVFRINPASIKITAKNNDGTPKVLVPSRIDIVSVAANMHVAVPYFGNKTRADWDNIRKWKFEYDVVAASGTVTNNILTISAVVIGCCQMVSPDPPAGRTPGRYNFGYSYFASAVAGGLESGVAGTIEVPHSQLRGLSPWPGVPGLGVWLTVTFATSADANVDFNRLYIEDEQGKWRRIVSQTDATTTYTIQLDYQEILALTQYTPNPFLATGCIAGIPFKGWVVWLYQGGKDNVRHSRIGLPESQASDQDDPDDTEAGENYSLADNFGDEPINGLQADDALIVAGTNGVYAHLGGTPLTMSFFKKLPGSFGVPGWQACCRCVIDGITGMAALAKDGEGLYFYPGITGQSIPEDYEAVELTFGIRPSLKAFLLTPQSLTSWATAIVQYEPSTDALWLIIGNRAMVLRRPSVLDGKRHWEFYRYTTDGTATFKYAIASTRRRMKWIRSTGLFDENEYRFDTSAYIDGSTRDGGSAMPASSIFWKGKALVARDVAQAQRAYAGWVRVARETVTDNPQVEVTARDRGTATATAKTIADNRVDAWFGTRVVGEEFDVNIIGAEGDAAFNGLSIELHPCGSRRRA